MKKEHRPLPSSASLRFGIKVFSWQRFAAALVLAIVLFASIHLPARAQDSGSIWLPTVLQGGASAEITSPDGLIRLRLYLSDARNFTGVPRFDVTYRSDGTESAAVSTIISGGRLGLDLKSVVESAGGEEVATALVSGGTNWRWQNATVRTVRSQYTMPVAERATIPDAYSELTVELVSTGIAPEVRLQLIARTYNEGIALRYRLPEQQAVGLARIDAESTAFAFGGNYKVWAQSSEGGHPHENEHLPATINTAPSPMENPLTIQHSAGFFMALTEAAVENYPASRFVRTASLPPLLRVELRGAAQGTLPFVSPWRVLMIAPTAANLAEQNYLIYNLAPASRIADTSWLKPGKAMRVMDDDPESANKEFDPDEYVEFSKSVIDFAASRGFQYISFDAGWYGDEWSEAYSPLMPLIGDERFEAILQHAKNKKIGVILYVNYRQSRREIDSIIAKYATQWGIAGIKLGFMDGLTQAGVREILYTVQKAAEYKIFVDVHDNYCPSGMSRTWPNLFTQECARGNEHFPGAEHNATLPFTRMLLGPADYTIAYYSTRLNTSRTHQIALSVIYHSPLKFLLWYDSPSDYNGEPEVDFFKDLPTRWDETRVLSDEVGDTVSIARRSGETWFIGSITDGTARTLELALDFLPAGESFTASLYEDSGGTQVSQSAVTVTNADVLTITLPANGGNAIRLDPAP